MRQAEVLLMKDDVILCFDICLVLARVEENGLVCTEKIQKLVEGNILA